MGGVRGTVAVVSLLALLAAGCLGGGAGGEGSGPGDGAGDGEDPSAGSASAGPAASPQPAPADGPSAYSYECPATAVAAPMVPAPVCAGFVTVPGQVLAEPYVALDPTRPAVIALAANAAGPDADGSPDPARPAFASALLVSEDEGGTWRTVALPALPGDPLGAFGSFGDPAVAFTPAGTLLFAGLLCDGALACDIVATASDDLGASWAPWTTVDGDGDNDREWLGVGRDGLAYLSWTSGGGSEAAVTRDEGATWTVVARAEACIGASPVADPWGVPHLACVNFDGSAPQGIRLVGAGAATGQPWATAERHDGLDMVWPRLHAKGPALVLEDYRNASVAVRWWEDSGGSPAGWGPLVDVRGLASVEDTWTRAFTHWDAVDAWGRLHLVLGGEPESPLAGPPDRMALAFAHVVLDRGGLVQEQELTTRPPPQAAALPGRVVLASDYAGLAFQGEAGVLAWPLSGGIAVTLLRPA